MKPAGRIGRLSEDDRNIPGIHLLDAPQNIHKRTFTGTVPPDDGYHFTRRTLHVYIF